MLFLYPVSRLYKDSSPHLGLRNLRPLLICVEVSCPSCSSPAWGACSTGESDTAVLSSGPLSDTRKVEESCGDSRSIGLLVWGYIDMMLMARWSRSTSPLSCFKPET